jgi:hypothetical protein
LCKSFVVSVLFEPEKKARLCGCRQGALEKLKDAIEENQHLLHHAEACLHVQLELQRDAIFRIEEVAGHGMILLESARRLDFEGVQECRDVPGIHEPI